LVSNLKHQCVASSKIKAPIIYSSIIRYWDRLFYYQGIGRKYSSFCRHLKGKYAWSKAVMVYWSYLPHDIHTNVCLLDEYGRYINIWIWFLIFMHKIRKFVHYPYVPSSTHNLLHYLKCKNIDLCLKKPRSTSRWRQQLILHNALN